MPFYDYRCRACQRKVSLFFKTYAAYDAAVPICPYCNSADLSRRIGRVAITRTTSGRQDAIADDEAIANLDPNDPRALGRFMQQMSQEMGEDMGEEFNEVVDRLEKGQSPEEIEKGMPDLGDSTADEAI